MINLVQIEQGAASSTKALPESALLSLIAQDNGLDEVGAFKLNEFLQAAKNSMVLVIVSPMPDDDQVEVSVRNGKDTRKVVDGKETGQDNSQTPVSQTNTYAKLEDVKLAWTDVNFDPKARFTLQYSITAKKTLDPALAAQTS